MNNDSANITFSDAETVSMLGSNAASVVDLATLLVAMMR